MQPLLSHLSISFLVLSSQGSSCGADGTELQRLTKTATHHAADHRNEPLLIYFFLNTYNLHVMHKRRHQHITSAGNKCTQVIKGLLLPDHELSCLVTLLRDPPFSPGSTASIPVQPLLNQHHLLGLSSLSPESLRPGHLGTQSSPH